MQQVPEREMNNEKSKNIEWAMSNQVTKEWAMRNQVTKEWAMRNQVTKKSGMSNEKSSN